MTLPRIRELPGYLRWPIAAFVLVGLAGYAAGLAFVAYNTQLRAEGIVDHYQGDEERMKFGKSPAEMLEIVHTHLLGMGVLFFLVASLFTLTDSGHRWKGFWATETILSLLTTFGALWLVTLGERWAVWVIYPSSVLMVAGYVIMSLAVLYCAFTPVRLPVRSG